MIHTDRKSVINGFIWLVLERISAQGVTFIVSMILARILDPDAYGTVAIVTVFTSIMSLFVDSGMGSALIQKRDADDVDFSSVFYANFMFSIILYIFLFITAPLIASFYEKKELTILIRVLGFSLVINGVKNVQQAYVSKNMLFKRFFGATLGGTIASAFVGIIMAYKGYGVWALVAQSLTNQMIDTMILWITVKWRPKLLFSFARVKPLVSFGGKLLFASLINTMYLNMRQLLIGKVYSTEDLAYYNRGVSFPKLFVTNINSSLASILFPVMSQKQENKIAIKEIVRKSILISTYVMFPIMTGLGVCATRLVRLLLTDKWLFCVPYLRIFCIEYAFDMFISSNLNSYQSTGRSDIFLRNEMTAKIIGFISVLVTVKISVFALALSSAFVAIVSVAINAIPNKKLINYGLFEQIKDILPNLGLATVMGFAVYCIGWVNLTDYLALGLQIFLGVAIYVMGSLILKLEAYEELKKTVRVYISHKKGRNIN